MFSPTEGPRNHFRGKCHKKWFTSLIIDATLNYQRDASSNSRAVKNMKNVIISPGRIRPGKGVKSPGDSSVFSNEVRRIARRNLGLKDKREALANALRQLRNKNKRSTSKL